MRPLLLLIATAAIAAEPVPAPPENRILDDYFERQVTELEGAPLAVPRSAEEWEKTRLAWRAQLAEMLGLSPMPERTPLNAVKTGEVARRWLRGGKAAFPIAARSLRDGESMRDGWMRALRTDVFEDGISALALHEPPSTHARGPIFLNVLKHLHMSQAVAMAAARCHVTLFTEDKTPWTFAEETAAALDRRDSFALFDAAAGSPRREGATPVK